MPGQYAPVSGPPPAYIDLEKAPAAKWSLAHPSTWGKKTYLAIAGITALVVTGAVVGGVEGSKADESYPDYSALSYTLLDTYHGTDFFDDFDFFNTYDPADGFVHYVPQSTANSTQFNLTYATADTAIMRVDTSSGVYDTSTGRYSVRITSKNQYDDGLFLFDVVNSPYGCSTWPALWLSDPSNWPTNGEIDVMEAVNQANTGNQMTLHTTDDCKMNVKRKETGTVLETNCWNETDSNAGCGVKGPKASYGEEFNENGGGIYAMELRDEGIRVWFFARDDIPSDIPTDVTNTSAPDPSTWGEALADFPKTHCDISSHFKNQSIIVDIDLCGDWAGATSVYTDEDACPSTCELFVADNATAYDTAYWEFNSFRVYQAS